MFARCSVLAVVLLLAGDFAAEGADKKVRLFILSGQSNMGGLDPNVSFTPTVKSEFADDDVIVVKHAQGGEPIRQWYKKWTLPPGAQEGKGKFPPSGDYYDKMMKHVRRDLGDKEPDSVAFVWMQGERDASQGWQDAYYEALRGLVEQLRGDLKHQDIALVIGRISDHANGEKGWDAVREIQVKVAADEPLGAWVDTDDINPDGRGKALHYNKPGYAALGKRFAAQTIELIRKHEAKK